MSMWDWDEQGDSYPPEERRQYRDPYVSHSGSSDYQGGYGGHQSHSDYSHHHHGHVSHGHDQHHHGHREQDDVHSSYSQRSIGASPSRQNYGVRHESYGDSEARQNYGRHDSYENQGHEHDSYGSPSYASNMARASEVHSTHYGGNQGYEIQQEHHAPPPPSLGHSHEVSNQTDLFTSDSVVNLTLDEIDALARTHRSKSWLVVLYAPWCRFCQAMEPNFESVARHLENSNVYVGRFQADGDYKEYAKRYLQLEHFPTILFFPKNSSHIVKYQSENREVDALLGFVQAFE